MSLFETLFPPQTRRAKRRPVMARRRRPPLREAESLERRQPLTINRITTDQFFIDPREDFLIDSQYAEFEIKDTGYIADAWVKVEMLTSNPTVSFGETPIQGRLNYEDGLYHIGEINAGEIKQAFIYFSTLATKDTDIDDPYRVTLYNGDPTNVVEFTDEYSFQNVQVTAKNDVNKLSTVTFSPGEPVIGGTLTMYVTGRIGQTVDRVLFTPASRKDWLPDVYRLESVDILVEGTPSSAHLLYYDPAPDGDPGNPFEAQYHFRIDGYNSDVIEVQPTQFTQKGKQTWEHHAPPTFLLPPVPFVKPRIDLEVFKTDGSEYYTPGQAVTYTVTVTNKATSDDKVTGVVVTDPLPAGTTFVSMGDPRVVYDAATNTVKYTTETIAKGGSETFQFKIQTPSSIPGTDWTLSNTVTATPPSNVKGTATSYTDTDSVKLGLTVTKTDYTGTYVPGTSTTYTILVTNTGPSGLVNGTVFDQLPDVALSGSWTAKPSSKASVSQESGSGNINVTVSIPIGESVEFTYEVKTKPNPIDVDGKYAVLSNTVTVTPPAGQAGGTSATDEDDALPSADLFVQKSRLDPLPDLPVFAGQFVTYRVTVTNNGPSSVVSFIGKDVCDPELLLQDFTVSTGSYNPSTGVWKADKDESFDPTEVITFTFSGKIPADETGLLVNTVSFTPPAGVEDPNPNNNKSTVTDTIAVETQFALSKDDGTDRYTPGTSTTYKIIVTNLGPSFLQGGIVEDLMPKPPQGGSATWTAKTSGEGAVVTPDFGGNDIKATIDLPVGGTATFFYTLNILATATGQLDNTVTVKPAPGTIGREVSVTDSNLPPTPPLSVLGGLVIGSDDGCNGPPFVRILDPNGGQTVRQFLVYEQSFRGSVRVATGDVTGDGIEEILVAPGRGRVGEIRVYTQFGVELEAYRTFPFGPKWRGGVEVTAADINGDNVKDIVAGMSSGTGMVSGFIVTPLAQNPVDPVANVPTFSFRGFPPRYAGGVMLAAGDFNLDLRDEIVVGSNAGRVATVNVWDVSGTPRIVRTILPFGTRFKGGVTLSVANYDNTDNVQDIFVGAGVGGKSAVAIYSGATGGFITNLPQAAFGSFSRPNAAVFTAALDLALTGNGPVTNVYGVQGRNGGRGTRGVADYSKLSGLTGVLPNSTGNLPPLRIAALKRRLLVPPAVGVAAAIGQP